METFEIHKPGSHKWSLGLSSRPGNIYFHWPADFARSGLAANPVSVREDDQTCQFLKKKL